jgi:hypothetical protein
MIYDVQDLALLVRLESLKTVGSDTIWVNRRARLGRVIVAIAERHCCDAAMLRCCDAAMLRVLDVGMVKALCKVQENRSPTMQNFPCAATEYLYPTCMIRHPR